MVVAERQRPQIGDGDRFATGVRDVAEEGPAHGVVGVDAAVAVVACEQSTAEAAEVRGSQRESPGRIERAPGGEAPEQGAAGVVNVDEPLPPSVDTLGPVGALAGVGDEKQVVDVLNVEGGKAARQVRVPEGP